MAPPHSFASPWSEMVAYAGSVAALARELHVDQMTVRRWALSRTKPFPISQIAINHWCRKRGLVAPFIVEGE